MTVTVTGFTQSTYVWTARAALTVKSIEHEFVPLELGKHKAPDYLARHPFGKVPLLEVDGKPLYETSAIVRWADATGSGPKLFPDDAFEAAQVEQWVSAVNAYVYDAAVGDYVLKYVFAGEGGPDRAAIDAAVPKLEEYLGILNANAADGDPWLVGSQLSAAELFVGPLLFGLSMFPEGKAIIGKNPKLAALLGALAEVPAFMAGAPAQ